MHGAHSSSYGAHCPGTLNNDRTEWVGSRLELPLDVVSRAFCCFVTGACIGSSSKLIPAEINARTVLRANEQPQRHHSMLYVLHRVCMKMIKAAAPAENIS